MFATAVDASTRFVCLLILCIASATACTGAESKPAVAQKPNIIFILCDDLGFGDIAALRTGKPYGKSFTTPGMDAMAAGGTRMTRHYCPAPVCAPSRASLLLGVHQGNCEIRDNQFDKQLPDNHTLGSVLQTAGYATVMVGKYGLQGDKRYAMKENGTKPSEWPGYPTKRGFGEFFGMVRHVDGHLHYPAHGWDLGNSDSHREPKQVWHNEKEISSELNRCYTTDLFTGFAKHWIGEHQKNAAEQPFFMYLAYDTPHAALQVPPCEFPQGAGVGGGVQWIGKPGKMLNTAVGEIDSYRHPEVTGKGYSDVEERFATMVKRIDNCVNDLLATLRDLEIDKNTLVVLTSDNGPHRESYLEGKEYAPTSFRSYDQMDGIKRDVWEGGIRMPTLAIWPGNIPQGSNDDTPSQFHDWMATFCDAAGIPTPARCDGVSLLPSMTQSSDQRVPSTVYIEYSQGGKTPDYPDFDAKRRGRRRKQQQVVYMHGYKGVRVNVKSADDAFEIYDVGKDPGEHDNLAGQPIVNDAGIRMNLQQLMRDRALRLRRPNASAKRPYDNVLIPAVAPSLDASKNIDATVHSVRYDANYPPTAVDFARLRNQNPTQENGYPESPATLADVVLENNTQQHAFHMVLQFRVPANGEYELRFQSPERSFVRLHDAILFDNDRQFDAGKTRSVRVSLAKGVHEVGITLVSKAPSPQFTLNCIDPKSGKDLMASWNSK